MLSKIFIITSLLSLILNGIALGSEQIQLTVGGTGSGLGFMRLLGDSYNALHPEVTVKVLPSLGTAGGIRAVKNGAVDLAVASRSLNEQESDGVRGYFLGESFFVFAVHPATEVNNVTMSEIVNIYNGTLTRWSDGKFIRRILRPVTDSDWQLMHSLSLELAAALDIAQRTEGLFHAVTDTDAVSYLERVQGSFGPSTLTMILAEKRDVKILSYNGIQPATTSSGKEKYPFAKPYHILVKADAPASVNHFIEFILSEHGQQLLAQVGVLPANKQP